MVMFELQLPAILAGIAFVVWNVIKRPKSFVRFFGRLLFVGACFLCFNAFFMPFPIDARGFHAISDPTLPLKEAIILVPFESLKNNLKYLDYYFNGLIPLLAAGPVLGLSVNLAFSKEPSALKNLLIAFLVPFGVFLIYAGIKLVTGEMYKVADITDVIWFMLTYFIGYGAYLLLKKLFKREEG